MRLTHFALVFASLALTAGPSKPRKKANAPQGRVHVVHRGETAASIARKHGLSVTQLRALNPGKDLSKLALGTRLRLAKASGTPAVPGEGAALKPGETLHSLAKREGFTVQEVLAANPGLHPSRIKAGTWIHLPRSVPAQAGGVRPSIAGGMPLMPALPDPRTRSLASLERLLPAPAKVEPAPAPEPESAKTDKEPLSQSLNPIVLPESQPPVAPAGKITTLHPADPGHLDLLWPVETRTISSAWGPRMRTKTVRVKNHRKRRVRYRGRHRGVDLTAPQGTDVCAALDGQVVTAGKHRQYGNYVVLDHGNGVATLYAHHRRNLVEEGEIVHRGQKIAEVGRTGNATGPHLHFELLLNGERTNPLPYLNDEETSGELQAMNEVAER